MIKCNLLIIILALISIRDSSSLNAKDKVDSKTEIIIKKIIESKKKDGVESREEEKKIVVNPIFDSKYPSGCEFLSSINLLNFYGYNITTDDFYNNYFIHENWFIKKGKIYAPDPNYAYPGNAKIVRGNNCGFGCFCKVISNSINNFFSDLNNPKSKFFKKYNFRYKAVSKMNISSENLINNYIYKKIPVLVWSTMPRKNSKNRILKMCKIGGLGNSWIIIGKSPKKGKKYTWIRGEHCMIIYDYDEKNEYYKVCDPFIGLINIDKKSLDESRKNFDNQIVYLSKS